MTHLKKGLHTIDALLFAILCLNVSGDLTFGLGLGDLFPVMAISIYILVNTILTVVIKHKLYLTMLLVISLIIFCWTIWGVTVGRGSEHSWNGEIFLR